MGPGNVARGLVPRFYRPQVGITIFMPWGSGAVRHPNFHTLVRGRQPLPGTVILSPGTYCPSLELYPGFLTDRGRHLKLQSARLRSIRIRMLGDPSTLSCIQFNRVRL